MCDIKRTDLVTLNQATHTQVGVKYKVYTTGRKRNVNTLWLRGWRVGALKEDGCENTVLLTVSESLFIIFSMIELIPLCKLEGEKHCFKALANEDTLLPTHCCRHNFFPVCPRSQHLLRAQILCPGLKKCFWFCSETFCVRSKCFPVCAAQEISWATMCPQQCVLVFQGL